MYSFERCTTTRTELPSDHSALLKVLSHRYGLAVENLCCFPKGELAYSYAVECAGGALFLKLPDSVLEASRRTVGQCLARPGAAPVAFEVPLNSPSRGSIAPLVDPQMLLCPSTRSHNERP